MNKMPDMSMCQRGKREEVRCKKKSVTVANKPQGPNVWLE